MIVTRRWLEDFIDLDGIDDDKLYATFNSIGLEVDSLKRYEMPAGVVVGRIVSCEKHPDADKLNVCQVEVGGELSQIVCGASNVVDAEYVAVATVGAVLPGDFKISPAKLRGVESFGMICSSTELGLPEMGDGIMILDDSIGELIPGRELKEYDQLNDTVVELELTANRGDCLSVHGVARDLGAVFDREVKPSTKKPTRFLGRGIGRILELKTDGEISADLQYCIADAGRLSPDFLTSLRLAFVEEKSSTAIDSILKYAIHSTGVILRAYDAVRLKNDDGIVELHISESRKGLVDVKCGGKELSIVGVSQNGEFSANEYSEELLLEASYIEPEILVDAVASESPECDALYYRSSRGSEPDLKLGMECIGALCESAGECEISEDVVRIEKIRRRHAISIELDRLSSIIGTRIQRGTVYTILTRLGFEIHGNSSSDKFGAVPPAWRHDMTNIHDVAEEILRMVGIDNIESLPTTIVEKRRLTPATLLYRMKRDIRQRAVSAGFYEAVTYIFASRQRLESYGFDTVSREKELVNPIVEEMDTLRTTLLVNLLEAVSRNVSYGKKSIPLFEIGTVFDSLRDEKEKIAFVWSGEERRASVVNHGKPSMVDMPFFIEKISSVTGDISLTGCSEKNGLIHPYRSADIIISGKRAGFVTKLHPEVAEEMGIDECYIAEMDLEAILPKHKNASPISNYQGVYKDLSLLVDSDSRYEGIEEALRRFEEPLLRRFFPVDIFESESLGEKKSLTVRFYLQSDEGTLSDEEIERCMGGILEHLERECGASLR